jgi:hypothetical protein
VEVGGAEDGGVGAGHLPEGEGRSAVVGGWWAIKCGATSVRGPKRRAAGVVSLPTSHTGSFALTKHAANDDHPKGVW